MVGLAEIQAAYYMVAATGVLIAAVFYILNLRISQRNQELMLKAQQQTLETRQAQLLMQIYQNMFLKDVQSDYNTLMEMEWRDNDDFQRKYGSENNPGNYIMRERMLSWFNSIGFLVKNGLLEAEKVYDVIGQGSIEFWNKFKDIYMSYRDATVVPDYGLNSEYLCTEMEKIRKSRGYPAYTSKMPMRLLEKE